MARLVPLDDPTDPRLKEFLQLRDSRLRRILEVEEGIFIAEGAKVIRRAVDTGHPVRALMMTSRWVESLGDLLEGVDVPVYVVSDATAEGVTGYAVHRGALAAMERLPVPPMGEIVRDAQRIVILEDLADHSNVGAIFRCAAALGVDAVVLSPRCADPLYRRAVKVSMGAVFAVPYARMTDWHNDLAELRAAGFKLLALTPDAQAAPMNEVLPCEGRVGLMLGSEGDGLSSRWLREADVPVRIPMSKRALDRGVDSLNVVAAASIACYALTADN